MFVACSAYWQGSKHLDPAHTKIDFLEGAPRSSERRDIRAHDVFDARSLG